MSKKGPTSSFKTAEFLSLQDEWYSKLKKEGFSDIEKTFTNGTTSRFLKQSCRIDPNRHPHVIEPTFSYYSLAGEFLYICDFENSYDNAVWEHYANGKSYRQIQAIVGTSLPKIHKTIKKYEDLMFQYEENRRLNEFLEDEII